MNRFTKPLVVISTLLALWLLARLVSRGFPPILVPAVTAFAVSFIASLVAGRLVVTAILTLAYAVPALSVWWFNNFHPSYYGIWLAALLGAMFRESVRHTWAFRGRWAAPLVLWALTLALVWPIIVLREADFVPALLDRGNLWIARSTVNPPIAATWIVSLASIYLTGFLLLDWLFIAYPPNENTSLTFERRVAWPLFSGAAAAGAVAVYQSFFDLTFLNRSFWPSLGRAVGTMLDANAFGMVMALWTPIAAVRVLAMEQVRPITAVLWPALFAVLVLGLWASGSRGALITAGVALGIVGVRLAWAGNFRRVMWIGGAVVLALAVIVLTVPSSTIGPWKRSVTQVAGAPTTADVVKEVFNHLWTRGLYGQAARRMFGDHPWVGIGLGGFNYRYADTLYEMDPQAIGQPDNAQNWYRHQLAELGMLGSIGWILWLLIVASMLARSGSERPVITAVKASIVGFGVGSFFGVPAQDAAASITFIVLCGWWLGQVEIRHAASTVHPTRYEWVAISLVLLAFLGATVVAARTELRPPLRAMRYDFPYSYGFTKDPVRPNMRWTDAKAVEIVPVENRYLKLVIGEVAPDAAANPVEVRVWRNDQLILRQLRRSNFPVERWVHIPDGSRLVMIQIEVGRLFDPPGLHAPPRGVAVDEWQWEHWPPKGAVVIE